MDKKTAFVVISFLGTAMVCGGLLAALNRPKLVTFQRGECIIGKSVVARCKNQEDWEKGTACTVQEDEIFFVKQVGKRNYLTYHRHNGAWYSYELHFAFADTFIKVPCPPWSDTP